MLFESGFDRYGADWAAGSSGDDESSHSSGRFSFRWDCVSAKP